MRQINKMEKANIHHQNNRAWPYTSEIKLVIQQSIQDQ